MFFYNSEVPEPMPQDQTYDYIAANILGYGVVEKLRRQVEVSASKAMWNLNLRKFETTKSYITWISPKTDDSFYEAARGATTINSVTISVADAQSADVYIFRHGGPEKLLPAQYSTIKTEANIKVSITSSVAPLKNQESLVVVVRK